MLKPRWTAGRNQHFSTLSLCFFCRMLTDNFEAHARRFLDPALPPAARHQLAQEIRESIEIVQTSEYSNFLQHFIRAFNTYLRGTSTDGSPYFVRPEDRFNTELPTYKTRSGRLLRQRSHILRHPQFLSVGPHCHIWKGCVLSCSPARSFE